MNGIIRNLIISLRIGLFSFIYVGFTNGSLELSKGEEFHFQCLGLLMLQGSSFTLDCFFFKLFSIKHGSRKDSYFLKPCFILGLYLLSYV